MRVMSPAVNAPSGTAPAGAAGGAATVGDARSRLLAAAVEAFAAKGFHGTTTRDIAAAAGMSPAALYVHHRSKEELLHAISSEGHRRTLALCEEAVRSEGSHAARLDRLVAAFARHHAVNHTSARVVNYELAALSEAHRAEIEEQRRRIEHVVRDLLVAGVEAGEFQTPDPVMTAAALLSLGVDVARWYRTGAGWTPEQLAEHYVVLARRMAGVVET